MGASNSLAVRQRGFTLLELIVATVIVSILAALAVPSFRTMIANNRSATHANALIQIITATRSEAIKRNRSVGICKTSNGTSCSNTLTWDQGIITFLDANGDDDFNTGETILRIDRPFARNCVITDNFASTVKSITYSSTGLGSRAGTFTLTPLGATGSQVKTVTLSSVGRPRVVP